MSSSARRQAINSSSPVRPTSAKPDDAPPQLLSPPRSGRTRPKKNASVTPNRLARFFTPRSSLASSAAQTSHKRRAADALSDRSTKRLLFAPRPHHDEPELPPQRRGSISLPADAVDLSSDWLPAMSSPYMRHSRQSRRLLVEEDEEDVLSDIDDFCLDGPSSPVKARLPVPVRTSPAPAVRRFESRSFQSGLVCREFSGSARVRALLRAVPYHNNFVASMSSTANDVYHLTDLTPEANTVIPFSMTTAVLQNNKPVTIIGDSSGTVQVLETPAGQPPRALCYWRAHLNAITALDFQGANLATASSDRTSRVIDFETGKTIVNLENHASALRNIKFRPSDPHVLMTSSRDGFINIWDIRHRTPSHALDDTEFSFIDIHPMHLTCRFPRATVRHARPVHTIMAMPAARANKLPNATSRSSITSVQWLPGRDHLFLSSSEVDAAVTLWDSRYISLRRSHVVPLARTALPTNDTFYSRDYGVTSLALSADATRVYATCRNSSIYAYSLPHLVLGDAAELKPAIAAQRALRGSNKLGLGPLFSMRHAALHIDSFWIKSAMLSGADTQAGDVLAVGNTATHPLVFSVDEDRFTALSPAPAKDKHAAPASASASAAAPTLPCYTHGVVLRSGIGARDAAEVTAVAWHRDGRLATVDDASSVRFYGQDGGLAARLRAERADAPILATHGYADVPRGQSVYDERSGDEDGEVVLAPMEFKTGSD